MKAEELKGAASGPKEAGGCILYAATPKRASGQKSICIFLSCGDYIRAPTSAVAFDAILMGQADFIGSHKETWGVIQPGSLLAISFFWPFSTTESRCFPLPSLSWHKNRPA